MCASPWLRARVDRNHAHCSERALYIVARSPACSSFFLILAYRTRFCQFWLLRLCVSSATPLRLVCCAIAPLLFSLLCSLFCSSSVRLCTAHLVSALLISSLLCSVSASRSAFKTSTPFFLKTVNILLY